MPIWPFKRRRRVNSNNAYAGGTEKRPLAGKAKAVQQQHQPTPAASPPLTPTTAPATLPRRSSRRGSRRGRRRASQQYGPAVDTRSPASETRLDSANKENLPPPGHIGSKEDITALPITHRLEQSPHLRPADLARPQIPYNFRSHSMSQTSVQGHDTPSKVSKSQTLLSKRSTTDYGTPSRKFSARSKRRDDPVREEEIRAMTAPIPIPKRHGEGLLRRDSKKVRGLNGDSHVSLPPEGSIHSSMSGVIEQRGWEIGSLAVFSPRPAVRLSGLPQYVSNSLPPSSSGLLYRIDSTRDKNKAPPTQESQSRRKRRTVGENADDLDASDIRTIMERDAKRREKRQIERQEQLDRKLKAKALRARADSGKKRTASEEKRRVEQAKARAGEQLQARGVLTPPSDVHPALRTSTETSPLPSPVPVGLGIGEQVALGEPLEQEQKEMKHEEAPENPFVDAPDEPLPSPPEDDAAEHTATIAEEEPYLGTAQAIRMSQANTPPLSPVYSNRITSSTSQLAEAVRQESMSQQSMGDLPLPPRIPVERRSSDPPKEKRAGTWATLFRRGGTFRRSVVEPKEPTESSFSNTSRESMRNQPLPAHLVGTDIRPGPNRRPSGTPARTQSKFREDLPEMPVSPPNSRTHSPDVTTAAAGAAAARRAGRISAQPVDVPGKPRDPEGDVSMGIRNDTPMSPVRGHGAVTGSMASIDSEGSWLASGSLKRQSHQSAVSKQLVQRKAEFVGSYEELGVDKDAEYLNRNISSRGRSNVNSPILGASPDEESEGESPPAEPQGEPMTVHGSVRRRPTLVQRDPRLKSREGLVQEYAAQEGTETPYEASLHTGDESEGYEPESPHPQIARATSVKTGNRHSRQISAGSARLLDVPAKRPSMDISRENTPSPRPTISRVQTNE